MTDHVSACRCIWCASDPGKAATQDLHRLIRSVLTEQDYGYAGQPSPKGMAWALTNTLTEAGYRRPDDPDLDDLARLDGVQR